MGLCIEDNQYSLVKTAASARDFWDQLQKYHEKVTVTSRVSLLKRLCNLNLREGGDLEAHLFDVEDLFERLENAGQDLENSLKIAMILRSLPDSYSGLVTALESRPDDDLTAELVKSKLLDEIERRKERYGECSGDAKAMKSYVKSTVPAAVEERTCFFCKEKGHLRRNCKLYLAKLKQSGGEEEKDRTPKAKKATTDRSGGSSGGSSRAVLFLAGEQGHNRWVIDSGASRHMTNDRNLFTSFTEDSTPKVLLANGVAVKSLGCGNCKLTGVNGCGGSTEITVTDVLYVPTLNTSLLSVTQLTAKGLSIEFKRECCEIYDDAGGVVAKGDHRFGSLYALQISEVAMLVECNQHNESCQHQWHRKFGHWDPLVVDKLYREHLSDGMVVKDCGIRLTCETCSEGKFSKTPIPKAVEMKTSAVLDLVHVYLCGPMRTPTPGGKRFLLTVTDDFSRYTVTYLLTKKAEAADRLMEYVRYVVKFFSKKPLVVKFNGGDDCCNEQLRNFFVREGIKVQDTTVQKPKQSDVAERRSRYLQEMAFTMLLDAKLDTKYWGEAVLAAAHLLNRMPSRSVDCTPFEKWFERKPTLNHLKVYGSKAWVRDSDAKHGKPQKLTFIGYSEDQKAYRFVDLVTEKVTISCNAKFLELEEEHATSQEEQTVSVSLRKLEQANPQQDICETEDDEKVKSEDESEDDDQSEDEEFFDMDSSGVSGVDVKDPLMINKEPPEDSLEFQAVPGGQPSTRINRGKLPSHLSDYVVGIATHEVNKPSMQREVAWIGIVTSEPSPVLGVSWT